MTQVDDVTMDAIKVQMTVAGWVLVAGAAFCFATKSVVPLIALFAVAGVSAANGASKAPKDSADRRFIWCVAVTWLVMELLACMGFTSRFWG